MHAPPKGQPLLRSGNNDTLMVQLACEAEPLLEKTTRMVYVCVLPCQAHPTDGAHAMCGGLQEECFLEAWHPAGWNT